MNSMNCTHTISCTTFNILAPIYKRLGGGMRESEFKEYWHSRNESIIDRLLHLKSSVICLQEVWVGNDELVRMYENRLGDAGYLTYKLPRTNNRGDGLLTAIHQNQFRLLDYRELLFHDIGDRVAQVLHVELSGNISQNDITNEILIVNTHLIFPHDSRYCFLRLQQVYKILRFIRSYVDNYSLPIPVILFGDWNGSKKGNVYKFLRSQGFESSYDIAHHSEDDSEDSQQWISHRNHRGNICGVDFIWLQNPQRFHKPLKDSFMEAILGNIKNWLHNVVTSGVDQMPEIIKTKGNSVTYSDFLQSLAELGICGHAYGGLKEIWEHIDEDRDGIADVEEVGGVPRSSGKVGLVVKKAAFFPNEVEKGTWPESWSLSDHALLTVEFTVKAVHCG